MFKQSDIKLAKLRIEKTEEYKKLHSLEIKDYLTLLQNANDDDENSINELVNFYSNDFHRTLNYDDETITYLELTSNKPYSCSMLARCYYYGYGVTEDKVKGKQLCIKSIQLKSVDGYFLIICMYHSNETIKKMILLNKAINIGNSSAMLAKALDTEDEKEKVKLLKQSIKLKNTDAIYHLGKYYYDKKEMKKAAKCYLSGVTKNNKFCMFDLAMMYEDEDICGSFNDILKDIVLDDDETDDSTRVIMLYFKANNLGHPDAAMKLGEIAYELNFKDHAYKFFKNIDNDVSKKYIELLDMS